jgi:hypothetical protein
MTYVAPFSFSKGQLFLANPEKSRSTLWPKQPPPYTGLSLFSALAMRTLPIQSKGFLLTKDRRKTVIGPQGGGGRVAKFFLQYDISPSGCAGTRQGE